MHSLQTIIKLNNQPVNQKTSPAVIRDMRLRVEASKPVPALDRVEYGVKQ